MSSLHFKCRALGQTHATYWTCQITFWLLHFIWALVMWSALLNPPKLALTCLELTLDFCMLAENPPEGYVAVSSVALLEVIPCFLGNFTFSDASVFVGCHMVVQTVKPQETNLWYVILLDINTFLFNLIWLELDYYMRAVQVYKSSWALRCFYITKIPPL